MKLVWVTYLGALSRILVILIPRISAHPPILAQCKVHPPWALFREGTVIPHDDHYRRLIPRERAISGCLVGKTREKYKVRHNNMTQIASLLAVVTVFTWLMAYNEHFSVGGGLIRKTKLPKREQVLCSQTLTPREGRERVW